MKAIGYVRVSTDDQSLGLEAQRAQLREWAAKKGFELEAIYEDEAVSGATPIEKRPGLTAALANLKRGATIIAVKRDRFARDPGIMIMLAEWVKRSRAKLATCDGVNADEGPTGELMAGMVDMFARFERRLIGARTSAALRAKHTKGEAAGGCPPYGWRKVGKQLEEHPEEQLALAFIRELKSAGLPLRGIALELEAGKHPPRGSRWHATSIARMLKQHSPGGLCTGACAGEAG